MFNQKKISGFKGEKYKKTVKKMQLKHDYYRFFSSFNFLEN